MTSLSSLSTNQKTQIRNAFTLIDGESRDSLITKEDLKNIYSSIDFKQPTDSQLTKMLTIDGKDHSKKGITFAQFSNIMAKELLLVEEKSVICDALKVFAKDSNDTDIQIDLNELKDACCSVNLQEKTKLSRSSFDNLVKGFTSETMEGKKVFLASKWIEAYID
ncbi:MLC2 [Candida pseudojiufengensis]|uniref:MLC2 n=1 Tax=Candida pseudojiufengensis TaxID=497109 RepID=UPI002224D31F|nr:MLC2 [Candida pseudojiufengensis]KAI5964248.1 MLC2 [Candida pseudojiufengensis]